jgi:hypothetical protein
LIILIMSGEEYRRAQTSHPYKTAGKIKILYI